MQVAFDCQYSDDRQCCRMSIFIVSTDAQYQAIRPCPETIYTARGWSLSQSYAGKCRSSPSIAVANQRGHVEPRKRRFPVDVCRSWMQAGGDKAAGRIWPATLAAH